MLDLDEGVTPSRLEPQFYQKLYSFLNPALELPRLSPEPQASPNCHGAICPENDGYALQEYGQPRRLAPFDILFCS